MKTCFKCNREKPLSEFYKHAETADGYLGKCKTCTKLDVRTHRRINGSVREYDRRRYHENPIRRHHTLVNAKKWQKNNPDGYRAHYLVSNAIRDGRLFKGLCEVCGTTENINAHHEDYSKPLGVIWLCATHHHRHHAGVTNYD